MENINSVTEEMVDDILKLSVENCSCDVCVYINGIQKTTIKKKTGKIVPQFADRPRYGVTFLINLVWEYDFPINQELVIFWHNEKR